MGKGKGQESSTRYEIWNYLQAWPISYQKAIKSFRDLEITVCTRWGSTPGNDPSPPPPHPPALTQLAAIYYLPPKTSLRRRRDACHLSDFFPPLFPTLFFWLHVIAARKKKHFRRARVETRSTETTVAASEDPSSSSSFSFSCNHLDGRFLFSCSKRFVASGDCLNQRVSTGTKSKG